MTWGGTRQRQRFRLNYDANIMYRQYQLLDLCMPVDLSRFKSIFAFWTCSNTPVQTFSYPILYRYARM